MEKGKERSRRRRGGEEAKDTRRMRERKGEMKRDERETRRMMIEEM